MRFQWSKHYGFFHKILGCSVRESVDRISIGSTQWLCLHPQIQIETWMGWMIVLFFLLQSSIIYFLERKKVRKKNQWNNNFLKKETGKNKHTINYWARLSMNNCCHSTHVSQQKSFIDKGLRLKVITYNNKKLSNKNINKKNWKN